MAAKCPINMNLTGHINPDQVMTFVYEAIEVPAGVSSISVSYSYSLKGRGNALDIGIFDQRGTDMADLKNGTFGARGWSGGFRDSFTITNSWATPGYNPGPISPGTWYIVWGPYSSAPEGIDWSLSIRMNFTKTESDEWFSPAYAATSLDPTPFWSMDEQQWQFEPEPRWLRGDFHLHTVHSDGRYLPEEQIANALDRKLDFIFFTEHNTYSHNDVAGAEQPEGLLIGRGIEVTTRHGHWNAIGLDRGQNIDWRYHPEDGDSGYPAAAAQVHRAGGLVSVCHPFALCGRCDWGLDWDNNDAIEVWNGPWDATDERAVAFWHDALVEGRRYAAIGGSDAHRNPELAGLPTTVVLSRGFTQAAIVEGARRGYAYLVKEPAMTMELTVGDYHVGQTAKTSALADDAKINLDVVGFGANGTVVSWISAAGHVQNVTMKSDEESFSYSVSDVDSFVRVEVRDGDGNILGLTNPIFFA
jgi:hypothetical protein